MKTPDYMLMVDFNIPNGWQDSYTLPAGSFVRPIELKYVPKHVTENSKFAGFDKEVDVFCYTRYGIVPIPRKLMRQG